MSPIMASTAFSTYTPAADRLLTLTNNLWLLRRAADGQAMGSGFSAGLSLLSRRASGRAHDGPYRGGRHALHVADLPGGGADPGGSSQEPHDERDGTRPRIGGHELAHAWFRDRWANRDHQCQGRFRDENGFACRTSRPVVRWEGPLRTTLAGVSAVLRSVPTADTLRPGAIPALSQRAR